MGGAARHALALALVSWSSISSFASGETPPAQDWQRQQQQEQLPRACEQTVPKDTRVVLSLVAPAFHGSTALLGVLMSNPHIATLCRGKTWECEGEKLQHFSKDRLSPKTWPSMLRAWSKVWNLSKPVLVDKSPSSYRHLQDIYKELSLSALPKRMLAAGIRKLQFVFIMQWRPPCLMKLSSHGPDLAGQKEAGIYAKYVRDYMYLVSKGVPVIFVNLADMMWRGDYLEQKLGEFLPCLLGGVRTDYEPRLGVDVVVRNRWKSKGSVRAFGSHVPPTCCNYSVANSSCIAPDGGWQKQYRSAPKMLEFLRQHS